MKLLNISLEDIHSHLYQVTRTKMAVTKQNTTHKKREIFTQISRTTESKNVTAETSSS
jgi:hypothetical protein